MKITWNDRVKNEGVLRRIKQERNVLVTVKREKDNWIGKIVRRNCILKHVFEREIEGRIEVTGRLGRMRKQLLDVLKEREHTGG
jgi:hypothetical protein